MDECEDCICGEETRGTSLRDMSVSPIRGGSKQSDSTKSLGDVAPTHMSEARECAT